MGQQIAIQQKIDHIQDQSLVSSRNHTSIYSNQYVPKEGILKISINPFPYASLIGTTINGLPIYAQKSKSLAQEIKERRKQMIFFEKQQILDFIESTVYTLASYEQQNIIYKDLCEQNIFITKINHRNQASNKMQFKLLPNPLIEQTTYERLLKIKNKKQIGCSSLNFSPQMLIAYRAKQKHFSDLDLLKKSNLFSLGMVFLQTATLQLSKEFYDQKTLDIFQQSIEQRLEQIHERYGSIIVKIIANMIDFDFQQRIQSFIQLAKWIILELETLKQETQLKDQDIDQCDSIAPSLPDSPKSITFVSFNNKNQLQSVNQQLNMMPVCHQKNQKPKDETAVKSTFDLIESQFNKENKSSQNQIKITVREVPVYLQKNSKRKDEKQNKQRLIHSPFVNSNKPQGFSSYERAKFDMMSHKKRLLAFEDSQKPSKNLTKLFNYKNTIVNTQR